MVEAVEERDAGGEGHAEEGGRAGRRGEGGVEGRKELTDKNLTGKARVWRVVLPPGVGQEVLQGLAITARDLKATIELKLEEGAANQENGGTVYRLLVRPAGGRPEGIRGWAFKAGIEGSNFMQSVRLEDTGTYSRNGIKVGKNLSNFLHSAGIAQLAGFVDRQDPAAKKESAAKRGGGKLRAQGEEGGGPRVVMTTPSLPVRPVPSTKIRLGASNGSKAKQKTNGSKTKQRGVDVSPGAHETAQSGRARLPAARFKPPSKANASPGDGVEAIGIGAVESAGTSRAMPQAPLPPNPNFRLVDFPPP